MPTKKQFTKTIILNVRRNFPKTINNRLKDKKETLKRRSSNMND